MRRVGLATLVALVAAMIAVATASATRATDMITCGGDTFTLTVTQTNNENSVAWGVGTISGGSHLIPTSFSFTATDMSTNTVLFGNTQAKGNGNGLHNQDQMTCEGAPETTTAGDLGIPGVNPADVIVLNFTVTAVPKL